MTDKHDGYIFLDEAARILTNHRGSRDGRLAAEQYLDMTAATGGVPGGPELRCKPRKNFSDPIKVHEADIEALRPHFAKFMKLPPPTTDDAAADAAAKKKLVSINIGEPRRGRRIGKYQYASDAKLVTEGVRMVAAGSPVHAAAVELTPRAEGSGLPESITKRLIRHICRECDRLDIKWRN